MNSKGGKGLGRIRSEVEDTESDSEGSSAEEPGTVAAFHDGQWHPEVQALLKKLQQEGKLDLSKLSSNALNALYGMRCTRCLLLLEKLEKASTQDVFRFFKNSQMPVHVSGSKGAAVPAAAPETKDPYGGWPEHFRRRGPVTGTQGTNEIMRRLQQRLAAARLERQQGGKRQKLFPLRRRHTIPDSGDEEVLPEQRAGHSNSESKKPMNESDEDDSWLDGPEGKQQKDETKAELDPTPVGKQWDHTKGRYMYARLPFDPVTFHKKTDETDGIVDGKTDETDAIVINTTDDEKYDEEEIAETASERASSPEY